jgi:exosortase H (IPTLxxWG-CTERM-specific)
MTKFFLLFLALLVVLFGLELTVPVQTAVVLPWTSLLAEISARVIAVFDPAVISHGKILQHSVTGVGVSIEAGCNGVEACIIVISAMLAYPAPWTLRVVGMVLGIVAVQVVNVVRVISLFFLADWNQSVFEFAHMYIWQVLIMLDVLVVWLVWIRQVARRECSNAAFA